ncbi:MAG: PrgI family protein [Microgenomates group bacterium]
MEQHPIPQQISSYEFKLVGDMTLKQFLKAAAGIILAIMINATGLIFFLKYPLMLIFGGGGLLLAFVPFEDRPMETWLIAFLRSIYSPTIYTYKKMPDKNWIELMNSKTAGRDHSLEAEEEIETPVKDRDKVREFIDSLPTVQIGLKANESEEINRAEIKEVATDTKKINKSEETGEKINEVVIDDWRNKKADLGLATEKDMATAKVVFGEIPMPDKPETANTLVGMATNTEGKIVEGAIVEIQDSKGNPSRVLKTNSLGQFRTTTPLANGKYLIITEKENLKFDKVEIELMGKTIEPIKIMAIV